MRWDIKQEEVHYLIQQQLKDYIIKYMEKRTYITQQEIDRLLSYLKLNKLWNHYIIIYNLILFQKPYIQMKKEDVSKLHFPLDTPIPKSNPFKMSIRGVNKSLKIHGRKCGISDISLTTKIFSRRFTLNGEIYYGTTIKDVKTYKKGEEGYIYVVRHSHRNPDVSKLLTDKKIGISYDYTKRLSSLTLGTVGIEIVKVWKMNSSLMKLLEKNIHEKLIERNLVGEWFSDEKNDLVDIVDNIIESHTPKIVLN